MRFRIYYGDGSVYSGDPLLAPTTNIQVIAQEDPTSAKGFILIRGIPDAGRSDVGWYTWRDDGYGWDVHDLAGFVDYLHCYHGPQRVGIGRTIPTDLYFSILDRAGREGLDG